MSYKQQGFTLIELMVALALGLIIVAAGTTLFISGQKSLALQQASGELQDNANFALNYITKNIRMTNLDGGSEQKLNQNTSNGGIVFGGNNLPGVEDKNTTKSAIGFSNMQKLSDQLTIRYKVKEYSSKFDCEGNAIREDDEVIERYFLRLDTNTMSNENNKNTYALACKATNPNNPAGLNGNGQVIIKRADYFKVMLIVRNMSTAKEDHIPEYREVSIAEYSGMPDVQIVGVRLAVVARSSQSIGRELPEVNSFNIFGDTVNLNSQVLSPRYLREVISQTVAIRNALRTGDQ